MKATTSIAALVLFVTLAPTAEAECLSCWTLQSVQVRLNSGISVSGHLPWNDGWVRIGEKRYGITEALTSQDPAVHAELKRINLELYTELLELSFKPLKGLRVATKKPIKIIQNQIAAITVSSGPHTGYTGAGSIEYVDASLSQWFVNAPVSFCQSSSTEDSSADCYWMNFSKEIEPKDVEYLCNTRIGKRVVPNFELNLIGVVRMCFAND